MTGSLLRSPQMKADRREATKSNGEDEADTYRLLLTRLQAAVRSDDRDALIALIDFPLRVNIAGEVRQYRDRQAVEQDFDRIFTAQVIRAIIKQKPAELMTREGRVRVGHGEIWMRACLDPQCSGAGAAGIVEVNP